jgi:hypothetical protein
MSESERRIAEIVNEWFQVFPTAAEQQRDRAGLIRELAAEVEGELAAARRQITEEIAQAVEDMAQKIRDDGAAR